MMLDISRDASFYNVIKWKHFPRYWPLYDIFVDLRLNGKAGDYDAYVLIMTSL